MYLRLMVAAIALISLWNHPVRAAQPTTPAGQLGEVKKAGDKGPILILIPCMSCRWKSFEPFMERNKGRYRMYAVTLPGFAGTAVPDLPMYGDEPIWHRNAIQALSKLIDREGLKDVYVVGHSFGGTIAMGLAHARPDAVAGLIGVDSFWLQSWEDAKRTAEQRREFMRETMNKYAEPLRNDLDAWQRFNIPQISDPKRRTLYHGWFMATNQDVVFQYWRENMLYNWNDYFARYDMPVLELKNIWVDSGDQESQRADYEKSWRSVKRPANFQLVYLYDTDHFTMEERPELFDRYIAGFIEKRPLADFRLKPDSRVADRPIDKDTPPAGG